MKREKINSDQTNFIGCWKILNEELFLNLINFFEYNKHLQNQGIMGSGKNLIKKKTTDITIDPVDLKKKQYSVFNDYFKELFLCFEDYLKQWPIIKENIKTVDIPSFNLQRYLSGDHFSHIHCERNSGIQMHRVFAWMTYLNTTEDNSGSTNFSHYNIKIKPETGKTLIWPAEWTHAHSGEVLNKGKKYIITGWMCFPLS